MSRLDRLRLRGLQRLVEGLQHVGLVTVAAFVGQAKLQLERRWRKASA